MKLARSRFLTASIAWAGPLLLTLLLFRSAIAEPPVFPAGPNAPWAEQMERTLQAVVEENRRLAAEIKALQGQPNIQPLPELTPADSYAFPEPQEAEYAEASGPAYQVGYDNGFRIYPQDLNASPYSLKINNQTAFRYTGYARSEDTWTDSAGNVNPLFNSSLLMIPRGRLILSGNAFSPDCSYLLNIDYNTVSNNPIGFRAYGLSYRFGRALEVHLGQNKVPGCREWLASSFDAQEGPDRSMAATFFRPSLSQGTWITGTLFEGVHYHAMVSNGFNTINVRPDLLDGRVCLAESIWWEPWGEFGRGYSDIQHHDQLVMRVGASLTNTKDEGSQVSDYPENSALRLSDGTLITQVGAFSPGVTLQSFQLSLVAFDLAFKKNGYSLATEIYLQELGALKGDGPIPIGSTQAFGGMLQGGWFVNPQCFELYARTSFVTGAYGSGTELGTGFNWFILPGQSNVRFTFDAAWLESSPAEQNRTGFVAGQTGLLIRTQIATSF